MATNGSRIPERVIDAPSQRLYVISLLLALQALKIFSFFTSLIDGHSIKFFFQWTLYDALFLVFLRFMRIPRLTFRWQSSVLQMVLLGMVNWLLFGNYTISFSWASVAPSVVYSVWQRLRGDYVGIDGYKVSITDIFRGDKHLLGQHTVKLQPISTGKLNPYLESFCIPPNVGYTHIPILFNNSDPTALTYSLVDAASSSAKTSHTLKKKDILARIDNLHHQVDLPNEDNSSRSLTEDEAFDIEFGEYDDPRTKQQHHSQPKAATDKHPSLQRTQRLRWIKLTKPGVIRLESVWDGKTEVRLRQVEVTVVQCPHAKFIGPEESKVRCGGAKDTMTMQLSGVPPLQLEWQREIAGKTEATTVEGIDPNRKEGSEPSLAKQEFNIPLALNLDALGEHIYSLNSIVDRLGNKVDLWSLNPRYKTDYSRTISVLKPAEFSFNGCRSGETISLLQGEDTSLSLAARYHDKRDGPWRLNVKYTPDIDPKGADTKTAVIKGWTKEVVATKRHIEFLVQHPGSYELLGVMGQVCKGDVLSPEVCRVAEVPIPKADIEWRKLHECSGDVGVTANLVLHGQPPFRVHYTTTHPNGQETTNATTINGSRGEVTLQPERPGSYVYKFSSLSDANYKNVPLNGPVIKQTVHPLATAAFLDNNGRELTHKSHRGGETTAHSCSGDTVDVPVQLRGTAPWNLELQVVGPTGTEKIDVKGVKNAHHVLKVKLPKDVDRDGGTMSVDLISVEDANGCKRPLSVPGVTINVRRVKPTAKFYAKDGKRLTEILMGETAHLPLRLTGDGPWTVKYRHQQFPERIRRERVKSANDAIQVQPEGVYELLEVSDLMCPGTIIVPEHTFEVRWIHRPDIRVSTELRLSQATNGSYIRTPVCVNTEDHIALEIKGSPPFQVGYNVALGKERQEPNTFSSLQKDYRLPLHTNRPGRVYYTVTGVGDSHYSLSDRRNLDENVQYPRWEQEVLARPAAYFKQGTRLSYCLNDPFVPRSDHLMSQDGLILFEGRPPFIVHFTIQNLASSETFKEMKEFKTNDWHLHFPNYIFTTVGSYLVTIDSVHDASSCDEIIDDGRLRSLWVDVAETAMIVPYERRTDVCVGDLLQFQLEGMPPWTISYRFNDRVQKTVQKSAKYTTVANVAGEFSVLSIAHQQAQCQTSVSDVRLTVHEIPSAQVSHGTRFEENIKEGEQAEIVFTLIGEAPFTFTYQRTELAQYAKGRKPKVMETHTVAGILNSEYSIFSSAEGTWTVTFISDKWCRYPPAKTDPSIEAV